MSTAIDPSFLVVSNVRFLYSRYTCAAWEKSSPLEDTTLLPSSTKTCAIFWKPSIAYGAGIMLLDADLAPRLVYRVQYTWS